MTNQHNTFNSAVETVNKAYSFSLALCGFFLSFIVASVALAVTLVMGTDISPVYAVLPLIAWVLCFFLYQLMYADALLTVLDKVGDDE